MKLFLYDSVACRGVSKLDVAKLKLLAETDEHIDFSSVIKLNGVYYYPCIGSEDWLVVRPLDHFYTSDEDLEEGEIYAYNEDKIHCPVCGYVEEDSFEVHEDDDDWTCPNCGSSLSVSVQYSVTYTTTCNEPNPKVMEL